MIDWTHLFTDVGAGVVEQVAQNYDADHGHTGMKAVGNWLAVGGATAGTIGGMKTSGRTQDILMEVGELGVYETTKIVTRNVQGKVSAAQSRHAPLEINGRRALGAGAGGTVPSMAGVQMAASYGISN